MTMLATLAQGVIAMPDHLRQMLTAPIPIPGTPEGVEDYVDAEAYVENAKWLLRTLSRYLETTDPADPHLKPFMPELQAAMDQLVAMGDEVEEALGFRPATYLHL